MGKLVDDDAASHKPKSCFLSYLMRIKIHAFTEFSTEIASCMDLQSPKVSYHPCCYVIRVELLRIVIHVYLPTPTMHTDTHADTKTIDS